MNQFEPMPPMKSTDAEANNWAMILHLSVFASYLIPLAGIIAPIAIWLIKKDQMPIVNEHGKIVMNWMISALVYALICFLLTFVVIGIFLFFVLGILCILFPIVGAIKAASGEVWPYPLSIKIF